MMKFNGSEPIETTDFTVADFWAWAYSDILSNRNRSIFAEYLVATALGVTDQPRVEWDAVDLRYQGKKIEVKSFGYIQSWKQAKLSIPRFDIAQKQGWDAELNQTVEEKQRYSDCYVFCVHEEQDPLKVNLLDLSQWSFLVIPTRKIDSTYGSQKSASLKGLQKLAETVPYERLKSTIEGLWS